MSRKKKKQNLTASSAKADITTSPEAAGKKKTTGIAVAPAPTDSKAGFACLIVVILLTMAWPIFHAWTTDRHLVAICNMMDPAAGTDRAPSPVILREMALDGYLWNRHALHLGEDGRYRLRWTDFDNAPKGRAVHWSSAFAWYLRGLGEIRHALVPTESLQTSIFRMSIWANPILLALFIPLLAGLAARRFGWIAGCVLAVGVVVTPSIYEGFLPAYPDHHGLIAIALLGTMLGLAWAGAGWIKPGAGLKDLIPADAKTAKTGIWISAIFGAAGFWVSALSQAMLMVGIGIGGLAAAWIFARGLRNEEKAEFVPGLWRLWGLAGGGLTLGFYLLEYFPSAPALRLEVNHPLYAAAWWGGSVYLAVLGAWLAARGQKGSSIAWRSLILPTVALSLIPAAVLTWGEAVHIGREPFFTHLGTFIAELKPLLWRFQTKTLTFDTAFGNLPILVAATVLIIFWKTVPRSAKTLLIFSVCPALVITALQFYQTRWGMLASPSFMVLAALVFTVLFGGLSKSPLGRAARAVALLAAAALFAGPTIRNFQPEIQMALTDPATHKPTQMEAIHLVERDVAEAIRRDAGNKPVVVLSSPNSSTLIGTMGDFQTIGTLYWENIEGLRASAEIFSAQTEDEALRLLKERGITHIALISWENFIEPYFQILKGVKPDLGYLDRAFGHRALFQRTVPRWARPLPYVPSRMAKELGLEILLLAVDPNQNPLEARYHLAAFLVARDEAVAAEINLKEILEASPGSDRARLLYAQLLLKNSRIDEALAQLMIVFETAPAANRAEIARDFANALAARGRNAEALKVISGANIPEADSPSLTNLRAWLLVTNADASLNRPEEALALLQGIEQRGQAENIPVLDSRAAALAAAGKYDEATAIIQNLIGEQERNNLPQDAATSRQRLERYKSGRPWTTQP